MRLSTQLSCLILWFSRLGFSSAAQKALRLEVGFDPGVGLPDGETNRNGTQHGDGQPSYFVTVGLGTPPQLINATLQLSSTFLLVKDAALLMCRDAQGANNCTGLAYDAVASSSAIVLAADGAYGPFVGDSMSLGGATLFDQAFDLYCAEYAGLSCTLGLMPGVQYYASSGDHVYPSVLSSLVMQEKISSRAFSLWLNRNSASTGLLVLGGVDTAAYNAPLITIPILTKFSLVPYSLVSIAWTGLTITAPNGTLLTGFVANNFSMAAKLDDRYEGLVRFRVSAAAAACG